MKKQFLIRNNIFIPKKTQRCISRNRREQLNAICQLPKWNKIFILKEEPTELAAPSLRLSERTINEKEKLCSQRTAPPLSELTTGLTVTHLRNTIESKISITRYTYIIIIPVLPQTYQPVIKQVCNKDTVTIKYV